jgi:hypothetical protein
MARSSTSLPRQQGRGASKRTSLLATVSVLALALGAAGWRRARARPAQDRRREPVGPAPIPINEPQPPAPDTGEITRNFLLYFIVPLWLAAGMADWACHRATDIEGTTGAKESLLHLLMLVEVSIPVLAGLFLEVTSPVLALMIAAFFLHEATALWDVSYAVTRREVTPFEQHVHSFLEMLPLMAISFIAVLHWPQVQALVGRGREAADTSIRWKKRPLPARYIAADLAGNLLFAWLPYLEELWRSLRAAQRRPPIAAARAAAPGRSAMP